MSQTPTQTWPVHWPLLSNPPSGPSKPRKFELFGYQVSVSFDELQQQGSNADLTLLSLATVTKEHDLSNLARPAVDFGKRKAYCNMLQNFVKLHGAWWESEASDEKWPLFSDLMEEQQALYRTRMKVQDALFRDDEKAMAVTFDTRILFIFGEERKPEDMRLKVKGFEDEMRQAKKHFQPAKMAMESVLKALKRICQKLEEDIKELEDDDREGVDMDEQTDDDADAYDMSDLEEVLYG
ncbi:hypothetical protein FPQ18DRAFT_308503 [Pyronema domesticum]|uniref:Uncharacterized protein n=1 Tax=Pyronema omphalodes (strain CBS 100304) TaxID=1076935 RepID=U4KUJ3_PYROM|nr:hypothetical protein FPQ18DRAFT_308503 [Pyronema domesticum]CCX04732.1 Protein of unknown function [Pyronema omphalodes CBS 100304]